MRIARLRLKNFGCFRGEHTLQLDAKAYAITAPNWAGKTMLVEAIDLVLYNRHRHRLDDEWITWGEQSGEVEIEFDTGERALRSRERGRATKFYYWAKGAREPAFKTEAQEALEVRVGLDKEDFLATCFFAQRHMARIILAKPEERMGLVSAWLKLDPLERCEASARARVNTLADQSQRWRVKRESARERMVTALSSIPWVSAGGAGVVKARSLLTTAADEALKKLNSAKAHLVRVETDWHENEQRRQAAEVNRDFERVVEEGKKLAETVDALDVEALERQHADVRIVEQTARSELGGLHVRLRQLDGASRGEFDGKCPIADITCPARTQINGMRDENRASYATADQAVESAKSVVSEATQRERDLHDQITAHKDRVRALERLRAEATKLADQIDNTDAPAYEAPDLVRARLQAARQHVAECTQDEHKARQVIDVCEAVDKEEAEINEALVLNEAELDLARAAFVIFGKQGAQRRIAEEVLGYIEQEANALLATCAIPLTIQVQWAREGTGLAKQCEACGAAYPASERVKACQRCGAPRGPQLVNKLDFKLSDRSGAAEDLTGIALQLAASHWLRSDRESDWSVMVLDEPFGQLDEGNRRALSQHLVRLIGSEQAFVIAHHAQVLDALPGRIEIRRNGNESTVRVMA